ncbi:MAG: tetratricopeptide repeat protein [Candidatus Promineifilaceae bacterium]|nr:tetratricopeptide repeat protein [Candidatus Promineifilaceae bacterium]
MMKPISGANLTLAHHYLQIGRPEQTLLALQNADETQLDDPFYWYLLAQALYDNEEYQLAAQAARSGLAQAPEANFLLYLLCNVESKQGNLDAAEEAILRALRQAPGDPQLLCRYAVLTVEGGQLQKAERLFDKARREDPQHPAVVRTAMTLAYLRGADQDVWHSGKAALSSDPDDVYGHYLLGHALADQGRFKEAERFLVTAARLDPGNDAVTDGARSARFLAHWLMVPLWPVQRFGRVKVWLAAIATMLLLNQLGAERMFAVVALAYLLFVAYSWVMPPLLRRWLLRRRRRF